MTYRIMGLDPAIGSTGVALPDGSTELIKPTSTGDDRLVEIRDKILSHVTTTSCTLVVCEDVPSRMQGAAGKVIPMLHGAIRCGLKDVKIPYAVISPSTLKKFATGKGTADKAAMILAAYKRRGVEYTSSDEADAAWLRWAGMDHYGLSVFSLPTAQRRALDVVAWPVGTRSS